MSLLSSRNTSLPFRGHSIANTLESQIKYAILFYDVILERSIGVANTLESRNEYRNIPIAVSGCLPDCSYSKIL